MKSEQLQVEEWIKSYGVRYFSEMTNTLLLMEEVGELARLIARKYGDQSFKITESNSDIQLQIGDELSDILFIVFCLSNQLDIDLDEAFKKNLHKKTSRDHKRHLENPKLKN
ncbi:MAG: nucleotide pyrophosphohydrolase [Saprospiraceae bacterium]|nr:nucleotide pyrophosphohydrolase [Saprospiraceae bacterium]HRG68740.1 nucleotide pyrophosphohydrolase [Saprospiraceae bacterium]